MALFRSYLQDRKQYVILNGVKSVEYLATSGVPQGSNLGPLLFSIFINDIVDDIDVNCLLYADDLKIFSAIATPSDCQRLAQNINRIERWCLLNNLTLNSSKCCAMTYTTKADSIIYNYVIDGCVLQRPKTFTDLGVTFDPELTFIPHIDNIVHSAFKMYGFVVRTSREFKDVSTLKTLYFAFVRSKLEYASTVWNPNYQVHIDRLESVQRRFLKLLSFKIDGSYPPIGIPHQELLERHSITSLTRRRDCSSVIFIFKLLNNIIDCPYFLERLQFHVPRLLSRAHYYFYLSAPRTNVLKYSPFYIMCNNCNLLHSQIDIFNCSIRIIKLHFTS